MLKTRFLVISRHTGDHIRITNEGYPYLVDDFRTWWLNLISTRERCGSFGSGNLGIRRIMFPILHLTACH